MKESLSALSRGRWLLFALVLGAALALAVEHLAGRRLGLSRRRGVHAALVVAAAAVGLRLAWEQRFLCDDAFISFRYARNLAEGYGLVWNHGELVEGYTNFLWTVLLAGFAKLGADIPQTALLGCLLSFVVAVVVTGATVRRLSPRPPLVPLSAIALAASLPFHTFATSGLETMPAAALVATALFASTLRKGALWAGMLLTAAALSRPDHALFFACFGLALAGEDLIFGEGGWWRRLDLRRYAVFSAPFLLVFVPYYLIRWRIYGDFYPNTYYAKSGDLPYWRQGFIYALHFIGTSGAWAWLPALVLALIGRPRSRGETRARLFAALALPVFGAYVMKVGGDFMEYRFFVVILPIAAAAAEIGLRHRLAERRGPLARWLALALAAAGAGAAMLPVHLIEPRVLRWGISREPSFYPIRSVRPLSVDCAWEMAGQNLRRELYDRGLEPPIAAAAIGLLGYHSRLPIVDALGLTNRAIAHKPIGRRTRPGHEKIGTIPELVAQGAVLDIGRPGDPYFQDDAEVRLGPVRLQFLRLDPKWAEAIGRVRGARVPQPERDVETIVRSAPRERVLAAVEFYSAFLDGHPLREPLLAKLRERLFAVADFEDGLPEGAIVAGQGLRVARGERPPGASGNGWLSSLPDPRGGGAGRVEIPLGILSAEELRFVLGGAKSETISVTLVVEGSTVRGISPLGTPALQPVAWPLDEWTGQSASLVIDDPDTGPEKGVSVDAIHFAPTEGDIRLRVAHYAGPAGPELSELLREARALLPQDDPDRRRLEARVATEWSLDALPPGTVVTGKAFGPGSESKTAVSGHDAVSGIEGAGYLNSGHGGDDSRGKVVFPEIILPREPIWVLVGGGRLCTKLYIGLEVEGRIVQRACGMNDQTLRRVSLSTSPYAGKRGRIVVVDDADGPWGHILADDILVLK